MAIGPLRQPSPRPTLIVNERGGRIGPNGTQVGWDGPLGNERVTSALPLDGGPQLIEPALVLHDPNLNYLADPDGNLIGERNATWVDRLLPATITPDTRRL